MISKQCNKQYAAISSNMQQYEAICTNIQHCSWKLRYLAKVGWKKRKVGWLLQKRTPSLSSRECPRHPRSTEATTAGLRILDAWQRAPGLTISDELQGTRVMWDVGELTAARGEAHRSPDFVAAGARLDPYSIPDEGSFRQHVSSLRFFLSNSSFFCESRTLFVAILMKIHHSYFTKNLRMRFKK